MPGTIAADRLSPTGRVLNGSCRPHHARKVWVFENKSDLDAFVNALVKEGVLRS